MPTDAKRATITELRQDISHATALVTTEYRGLKVKEFSEIRRALRKHHVNYRVVKNRLMRIAAQEEGRTAIVSLLIGPSAIAFGSGDEAQIAKTVLETLRPFKLVKVTGGVVGHSTLDLAGVQRLATLPSRDVLLAQLGGALTAPATQVAGLLSASLRNLGYALPQLQDQKAAAGA